MNVCTVASCFIRGVYVASHHMLLTSPSFHLAMCLISSKRNGLNGETRRGSPARSPKREATTTGITFFFSVCAFISTYSGILLNRSTLKGGLETSICNRTLTARAIRERESLRWRKFFVCTICKKKNCNMSTCWDIEFVCFTVPPL